MKVHIFAAEHVTFHQDNTFTAVRAGVERFRAPEEESIPVSGHLVVMIQSDPHETGEHSFSLSVINRGGSRIAPDVDGEFTVPEGGGRAKFTIPFQFEIEQPGTYEFGFTINGEMKSRWKFQVENKKNTPDTDGTP